MTIDDKNSTARRFIFTATDDELIDDLDVVVASAADGEGRAVGAIAIVFGPILLDEARQELGKAHQQDAGDVVQDLCVALLERRLRFPRIRGAAIPWLKRTVRMLARAHVDDRGPDWDLAG